MAEINDRSLRVLLVDDDIDIRLVVGALIRQRWRGVHLELVSGGREALQKLDGGSYDVVLTDVQMPEMDGYETAAAIRKMPPPHCHMKIICMSGGDIVEEKVRENSIDACLRKPFSLDDLRLKISEVVGRPLWTQDDS